MFYTISAQWKHQVDESAKVSTDIKTIWGESFTKNTLPLSESKRSWSDVVKGVKYSNYNCNVVKDSDDGTK